MTSSTTSPTTGARGRWSRAAACSIGVTARGARPDATATGGTCTGLSPASGCRRPQRVAAAVPVDPDAPRGRLRARPRPTRARIRRRSRGVDRPASGRGVWARGAVSAARRPQGGTSAGGRRATPRHALLLHERRVGWEQSSPTGGDAQATSWLGSESPSRSQIHRAEPTTVTTGTAGGQTSSSRRRTIPCSTPSGSSRPSSSRTSWAARSEPVLDRPGVPSEDPGRARASGGGEGGCVPSDRGRTSPCTAGRRLRPLGRHDRLLLAPGGLPDRSTRRRGDRPRVTLQDVGLTRTPPSWLQCPREVGPALTRRKTARPSTAMHDNDGRPAWSTEVCLPPLPPASAPASR